MRAVIGLMFFATGLCAAEPYHAVPIVSPVIPKAANKNYRLLVPTSDGPLPLVVYLHGAGSKGNDNTKPLKEQLPELLAKDAIQKRFPCLVLVPQCAEGTTADGRPCNWVNWEGQKDNPPAKWEKADAEPSDHLKAAMLALKEVQSKYKVDPRRIYLTGVSMGGSGACNWAAREPKLFAAVLAACGLGETDKAKQLATVPLSLYHGSDDPVAPADRSRKLAEAVKAAGGTVTLTEYTGAGHGIAVRVFTENDHAVLKWLFEQKRVE